MTERVTMALDDGIDEMLVELAGSPRRRGAYVSDLVRAAWSQRGQDETGVDVGILDQSLRLLSSRVDQIEQQLAAVIAKGAG